jgi:hypothetical protein
MTFDEIVARILDFRGKNGSRYTEKAARKAAQNYIDTMVFTGLLIRCGARYFKPEELN